MRQGRLATLLGTVLLLDVLRVFLPSLITLFGQAGSTGPEVMGAYALAWFLLPFPAVLLTRWVPPATLALVTAGLLVVGRIALQATEGGDPQLYLSSALVGLGVVWLTCVVAATATDGRTNAHEVMIGVVAGTAASSVAHTALGTVDPLWREGVLVWTGVVVVCAAFLAASLWTLRAEAGEPAPVGPRAWLSLGPLLFLTGLYTANPAVARTLAETPYASVVIAVVAVLSVAVTARPRAFVPGPLVPLTLMLVVLTALSLVSSLDGDVPGVPPTWTWALLVPGQLALAACAGLAVSRPAPGTTAARTGALAASGLLLFVVLVFAFYAAYDLHIPNTYVPFLALLLLAAALPLRPGTDTTPPARAMPGAVGAAALALAVTLAPLFVRVETTPAEPGSDGLRVAAYNVRMGFGMDGRLSTAEQAETLRALDADVIALGEVDRGWLLNGGHDHLSALAEHLGMTAYWGPADGPFWGDALLTNLPVTEVRGHTLPASGPTGAQALEATLTWRGADVTVIATHLQPEGYDLADPSSRAQLAALMEIAEAAHGRGTPVVVAGDLNLEPEDLPLGETLHDAFADARPFPTMVAAARSEQQIDHILVTDDWRPSDPAAPDVPHSDHRPIAITLHP
ncbi:endonuclease/exonuclease/phosphatase family protein [Nocardiopsis alba]|uniref:endonuclease/exonuclease/phosphatase family protein n=1 Tax=Nocardiopsis alba TaxID=53437 RepID=UPI00034A9586|nr:endonuclease/exonuclease/phosphatase family protein [Nocardiopsis alba]